jgi:hypothetical protein
LLALADNIQGEGRYVIEIEARSARAAGRPDACVLSERNPREDALRSVELFVRVRTALAGSFATADPGSAEKAPPGRLRLRRAGAGHRIASTATLSTW